MPTPTDTTVKRTHAEFTAEMTTRFGPDPMAWAFVCPNCGDVATVADLNAALDANPYTRTGETEPVSASQVAGQQCIGRILPTNVDGTRARGCDWAAFGLFRGPEFVVFPDGHKMPVFAIAPAPTA